jgi:hypothetical protein
MGLDYSTTSAILKELYPLNYLEELGYKDNPIFGMMKKDTGAGGDQEKIPVDVSPVQAASATFSSTQTQAAAVSSTFRAFEVTTVKRYSLARIEGQMIRATRNNTMAFTRALDKEIRNANRTFIRGLERQMSRNADGSLGAVGTSGITTTSLTLANTAQAHSFEYLMEVVGAADNTSALRDSGNSATITGIDRATGVLTTDSNWTTQISGLTDADLLFPVGDYVSASDRLAVSGFEAWVPATAPTSGDSFFGVDRSIDTERLAGVRYDGSSDTIEEALVNGQSEGSMNSGTPDYCFMNNKNLRRLVNSLGSKRTYYQDVFANKSDGTKSTVGYRAVMIDGDTGPIYVLGCPLVPIEVAWMVDMDSWCLFSMGEAPGILDDDGLMIQRVYNSDDYEVRVGGYLQQACFNPGSNVRIKLS